MSELKIQGTLKVIGETKQYGQNGFQKREFVITTDEQYPQDIPLEMIQGNCDKLDSFQVDQNVEVVFAVKSKEYVNKELEKKYFVSLNSYKISLI